MLKFLGGRILKRMFSDLSITAYVMETISSDCLFSITSIILISFPRLETLGSKDKKSGKMVNAASR